MVLSVWKKSCKSSDLRDTEMKWSYIRKCNHSLKTFTIIAVLCDMGNYPKEHTYIHSHTYKCLKEDLSDKNVIVVLFIENFKILIFNNL